jgi:hypothetical protein
LMGCAIFRGSFSAILISVWKATFCGSLFGLNIFSKCPAKVFAFFYHIVPRSRPRF